MKIEHFEDLWEFCENHYKFNDAIYKEVLNELLMKVNLYKTISTQSISEEELNKAKAFIFGEILLSLTILSKKDNINKKFYIF